MPTATAGPEVLKNYGWVKRQNNAARPLYPEPNLQCGRAQFTGERDTIVTCLQTQGTRMRLLLTISGDSGERSQSHLIDVFSSFMIHGMAMLVCQSGHHKSLRFSFAQ